MSHPGSRGQARYGAVSCLLQTHPTGPPHHPCIERLAELPLWPAGKPQIVPWLSEAKSTISILSPRYPLSEKHPVPPQPRSPPCPAHLLPAAPQPGALVNPEQSPHPVTHCCLILPAPWKSLSAPSWLPSLWSPPFTTSPRAGGASSSCPPSFSWISASGDSCVAIKRTQSGKQRCKPRTARQVGVCKQHLCTQRED